MSISSIRIAQYVQYQFNPELRKELGENGYRLAGEHSWQAASQSYLASYGINYQT